MNSTPGKFDYSSFLARVTMDEATAEKSHSCILEGVEPEIVVGEESGGVSYLEARLPDEGRCGVCDGTLHLFSSDEQGRSYAVPCEGQAVKRRAELFNLARIPSAYRLATVETLSRSQAAALDVMSPGDQGWWLFGRNSTGKTHTTCAAIRHFSLSRGIRVRFVSVTWLLDWIRASYDRNAGDVVEYDSRGNRIRTQAGMLSVLGMVPVLALDDIGKVSGRSDFEIRILSSLVERRANSANLVTFVTSNPSPGDLLDREEQGTWGVRRLISRLERMTRPIPWTRPSRGSSL